MLLHIEDGKGGRDRYAMLSPRLLDIRHFCALDAKPQFRGAFCG
jgi:hypothetical protein